jgi:hypothetical protein
MSERIEMTCEGCRSQRVYEAPTVRIAEFLRESVDIGWQEIAEQENIPVAMEAVARATGYALIALFDALCPKCVELVREFNRARPNAARRLETVRR